MKKVASILFVLAAVAGLYVILNSNPVIGMTSYNAGQVKKIERDKSIPLVQIALLLDTSGSMDGLIEQAKSQLWKIVNQFALSKRDGKAPEIEVALYEYGNDRVPADYGYVRMIKGLTTDLDAISSGLFSLKTDGGEEYCGRAIMVAANELAWSSSNDTFKAIFIAGNEPFTQGNVDYRTACRTAIQKGIIVNTIFCGSHQEGVNTNWKTGATLADGRYINIDQNVQNIYVAAPQDIEIANLSRKLNDTVVAYNDFEEKVILRDAMDKKTEGLAN
ncbi:MAG: vWA domain-containing protein, partial [Candidatus Margulisiibacteriota bacterium]